MKRNITSKMLSGVLFLFLSCHQFAASEVAGSFDKFSSDYFIQILEAFCLCPTENMARKLYLAIPEKINLSKEQKIEIGTYLYYGGFGYEIEAGNRNIIKASWKILKAVGDEEDAHVRRSLSEPLYMPLGHLIRLKPALFLDVANEMCTEIDERDLRKAASFLAEDFWFYQWIEPDLCSISPLEILCVYQLLMRRKALERVDGFENIKELCFQSIDRRISEPAFNKYKQEICELIENNDAEKEIVERVAELSRFISYYKKSEIEKPELLPENYDQLKKSQSHFRLQNSLTDFLFREAESYNRYAANVFIKGEVGYHLESWLSTLGGLVRKDPQYFLEIYGSYKEVNKKDYESWLFDGFNRAVIKAILKKQNVLLEVLDEFSSKVELLPEIIELEKSAGAIASVEAEKYSGLKKICLAVLEKTLHEEKRKLFSKKFQFESKEGGYSSEGEGYLYDPPESFKKAVETFCYKASSESAKNLLKVMAKGSKLDEGEDLGLLFIIPEAKAIAEGLPAERYLLLEKEAYCGNREAMQVLFALYIRSSDFLREIIMGSLSNMVAKQPAVFIEVSASELEMDISDLKKIVMWIDLVRTFSDDADKMAILNQRIAALKKIRNDQNKELVNKLISLIDIKTNC